MEKLFKSLLLCAVAFSCMSMQGSLRIAAQRVSSTIRAAWAKSTMVKSWTSRPFMPGNVRPAATTTQTFSSSSASSKTMSHGRRLFNAGMWSYGIAFGSYYFGLWGKPCVDEHIDARKKYDEYLKGLPSGQAAEKYIKWRNDCDQELFNEFLKLADCTKEEFDANFQSIGFQSALNRHALADKKQEFIDFLTKHKPFKQRSDEALGISPALESAAVDSLKLAGINPDTVKRCLYPKAEMTDPNNYMGVFMKGASLVLKISQRACEDNRHHVSNLTKFALMHEMQHLLHNDISTYINMRFFLAKKKIDAQEADAYMLKRLRFYEKRADIFAGLSDIKLVDARYENCSIALQTDLRDHNKDEHDTPAAQLAYIKDLHEEMLVEIEKNNGGKHG